MTLFANKTLRGATAAIALPTGLAVLFLLLNNAGAGNGKGKGGNNPPPPPPPVTYQLTWLGTFGGFVTRAMEVNNSGVVVGYGELPDGSYRAFRVVPAIDSDGLVYDLDGDGNSEFWEDLNDPSLGANWVDETGDPLVDQDWTAERAYSINSHGEIVGVAIHNVTGERSAFHFDIQGTDAVAVRGTRRPLRICHQR